MQWLITAVISRTISELIAIPGLPGHFSLDGATKFSGDDHFAMQLRGLFLPLVLGGNFTLGHSTF